jgi:hypothetical protein
MAETPWPLYVQLKLRLLKAYFSHSVCRADCPKLKKWFDNPRPRKAMMTINNRHRLLLRVSAIVAAVVIAKLLIHFLRWEIISINPLFSGIVAANVFLMGFLLSGVLSDFKESERYPGELSACLENLAQEVCGIRMARP